MKRCIPAVCGVLLCAWLLSGCSRTGGQKWLCTAEPVPGGGIALCEGTLSTETGMLCVQNPADTAVTVYLYDAADTDTPRYTLHVGAGGVSVQYQVPADAAFVVGLSANARAAGETTVIVSDHPGTEPFVAD